MNMLAYIRVSTDQQAESGLGLEAQRAAIETECSRRHWPFPTAWYEDHASSGGSRPALERCLLDVQAPNVDGIMIAKLDRIGRSVHEVSGIIEEAVRQRWQLVCLAPVVDMSDPYGRAMAQMACIFAELEREMIRMRTREAAQAKIARGEWWGQPPVVDVSVEHRVRALRHQHDYGALRIANILEAEGVPTINGRPWSRGTVQVIINRLRRDDELGRTREAATS